MLPDIPFDLLMRFATWLLCMVALNLIFGAPLAYYLFDWKGF